MRLDTYSVISILTKVLDVKQNKEGNDILSMLEEYKNNFGSIKRLGDIF